MTTAVSSTTSTSNSLLQNYLTQQAANVAADQAAQASGTTTSSSGALAQATSASTIGSNFNTFINILTTQLQNQDPTNATDPNQFTEELVQFAGVEQQLNTNNDLQTLINLQKNSSGANAALSYIGSYVEGTTTTDTMSLQSGAAEMGYTLSSAAQSAVLTIKDSSGNTVDTIAGSTNAGTNYIQWNGENSDGTQLADGAYTFTIAVTNPDGSTATPTDIRVIGQVTAVTSNSDGSTELSLGNGVSVATANVDGVYLSTTKPATTTTSTGTSTTTSSGS